MKPVTYSPVVLYEIPVCLFHSHGPHYLALAHIAYSLGVRLGLELVP